MQVKLEKCPAAKPDAEVYDAVLYEDGDDGRRLDVIGHAKRAVDGADAWEFRTRGVDGEGVTLVVQGATVEDAEREISKHLAPANFSRPDRLSASTMARLVDDSLDAVIALAETTDTMQGFMSGMAEVLARITAQNVPLEKHEAALDELLSHIRARIGLHQQSVILKNALHSAMSAFVKVRADGKLGDDDDNETKH